MLPDPAALGLIPSFTKKMSEKQIVNVNDVNQWPCLQESGQWHENVYLTRQVLASGNLVLVLQKRLLMQRTFFFK